MNPYDWNHPVTMSHGDEIKETTAHEIYYDQDGFNTAVNELIPFLIDPCGAALADSYKADREQLKAEMSRARRHIERLPDVEAVG